MRSPPGCRSRIPRRRRPIARISRARRRRRPPCCRARCSPVPTSGTGRRCSPGRAHGSPTGRRGARASSRVRWRMPASRTRSPRSAARGWPIRRGCSCGAAPRTTWCRARASPRRRASAAAGRRGSRGSFRRSRTPISPAGASWTHCSKGGRSSPSASPRAARPPHTSGRCLRLVRRRRGRCYPRSRARSRHTGPARDPGGMRCRRYHVQRRRTQPSAASAAPNSSAETTVATTLVPSALSVSKVSPAARNR